MSSVLKLITYLNDNQVDLYLKKFNQVAHLSSCILKKSCLLQLIYLVVI